MTVSNPKAKLLFSTIVAAYSVLTATAVKVAEGVDTKEKGAKAYKIPDFSHDYSGTYQDKHQKVPFFKQAPQPKNRALELAPQGENYSFQPKLQRP